MKLPFVKMEGLGNDYVYLDAFGSPTVEALLARKDWPKRVRAMSDRHTGIGSDGVIVVCRPKRKSNHARMRMFNADGSEGRMCGNGARCVAKFAHDRLGLGDRATPGRKQRGSERVGLRIESASGVLQIDGEVKRRALVRATVDMGKPVLDLKRIGVNAAKLAFKGVKPHWGVLRGEVCVIGVFVSMGNPHMVVMEPSHGDSLSLTAKQVRELPLEVLGPMFETHPAFKDRINVHFAAVEPARSAKAPSRIIMRTWERGAGQTRACASGACAALVAGVISGRCGREAAVVLPGGELSVRWEERSGRVFQTGPAEEVFEGVWSD